MASIICRDGRWRAQVRRNGARTLCRTFDTEELAKQWATAEEKRIGFLRTGIVPPPTVKPSPYQVAGVYMLLRGTEVRYVGRSVHIYRRLNDHARKALEWDTFQIWPCSDSINAAELERRLIEKHHPPLNSAMKLAEPRKRTRNPDAFTRFVKTALPAFEPEEEWSNK